MYIEYWFGDVLYVLSELKEEETKVIEGLYKNLDIKRKRVKIRIGEEEN